MEGIDGQISPGAERKMTQQRMLSGLEGATSDFSLISRSTVDFTQPPTRENAVVKLFDKSCQDNLSFRKMNQSSL